MADDFTILRYMSWRDICRWILLVRVFRIAISVRVLALSFVAVVMTTVVWNFSRTCCLSTESLDDSRFADVRLGLEEWPSNRIPLTFDGIGQTIQSPPLSLLHELCPVTNSFMTIAGPFFRLFGDGVPWDRWLYLLLGGSLSLLVWSYFGLAIARIAAVRLGRGELISLGDALAFAFRKWLSCFAAPIMPLVAILGLSLPLMLLGVVMRADAGVVMGGIVWPLVILAGILMTGLGVGLVIGWPLMWGTLASESSDAFDAVSRAYSYSLNRPLQYLFYAAVAMLLGTLGWTVVWFTTECIIQMAGWAVSIGTGQDRWGELGNAMQAAADAPATRSIGVWIIGFFNAIVRTAVEAFNFGYFWASAVALYLLLRLDSDQTELDDIYFADEDNSLSPLPQFDTDAAGGPNAGE